MKTQKTTNTKNRGRAFQVTITETRKRTITVYEEELKEKTAADAEQTVSDWWHMGQIILGDDDFDHATFVAEEIPEGGERDA